MSKISSVFDLNVNDKVRDSSGKLGIITNIKETSYECIEAFVIWDGAKEEEVLNIYTSSKDTICP